MLSDAHYLLELRVATFYSGSFPPRANLSYQFQMCVNTTGSTSRGAFQPLRMTGFRCRLCRAAAAAANPFVKSPLSS